MTVIQILKHWLITTGHYGLVEKYQDCSCSVDNLAPCESPLGSCVAAFKGKCTCGNACDFDVYINKEEAINSFNE